MDTTKRSAGRMPLRVYYRIAAIKLTIVLDELNFYNLKLLSPALLRKRGTLKLIRPSFCPSVRPSGRLSVTKTLTWLISSEVLKIEH